MSRITRALVLAPMSSELRPVVRRTKARPVRFDEATVHFGRVGSVEVLSTRAGVGPENAFRRARWVLDHLPVEHVVVCGVAGGLSPECGVGALVVPSEVLDHSSGLRYTPSRLGAAEASGLIATVEHAVIDPAELESVAARGAVALEMESSGVARACEAAGIPWTVFRVVSDRPDEGLADAAIVSLLRPDGRPDLPASLRLMIGHPGRIPAMARLARDVSHAASKAADAALVALGQAG